MKLPNKIISYKESVIYKFPLVLDKLAVHDYGVMELYSELKNITEDAAEFLDILDCLFALGKISYNESKRSLAYVI